MMTHSLHMKRYHNLLACLALCAEFAVPGAANAALVNLANAPLATSTTTSVLPNIMFILDDSGSMDWDYLPDWANDTDPITNTGYSNEPWLFKNNDFNGVAYNPAITYSPPVFYDAAGNLDTTTYPSQIGQSTATGADATAKPNWKAVKNDGYGIQFTGTSNLVGNASSYVFVPGEYCTNQRLTNCVAAAAPTASYPYAAPLRWCNSAALSNCQSINNATFSFPRYSGARIAATITVTGGGTATTIKVNGLEILSAATTSSTTTSTVASRIVTNINNCTASATGNCQIAGYSAIRSGSVVIITAPAVLGAITYTPLVSGTMSRSITAFGLVPGSNLLTNIVSSNNSYAYPGTTSKAPTRTDCTGITCTYVEEMTNYANWWTYYHTRMQSMKTAVSRAFKNINNRYRVGFSTISYTGATDGTRFLGNNTFELAYKNKWYKTLFAQNASAYTPLRGALSKAGLYYANKISGQVDPIQYSCQQNFTILSTDGYWNTNEETSTYTSLNLTGGAVGNQDGGSTPRPMKEGTTAVSDTLADIAKYYYDTDLRTVALNNCTGVPVPPATTGNILCSVPPPPTPLNPTPDDPYNNVFVSSTDNNTKQHMTTFTIGLGADGTLVYQDDYLTAKSGDFYDLSNNLNSVNWSNPIANSGGERIDDLWHAAVNGHGQYFSAKTPEQIVKGLNTALASISAKLAAGAAAATSTLNPVASNNKTFVASYTTVSWRGNLEARSIDLTTGATSDSAIWCVEDVPPPGCTSPSYLQNDITGGVNVWYCVTPSQTSCTGGTLVGTDCKIQVTASCQGTLKTKVASDSDTRTIFMKDASGSATLINFYYDNMTASQKAYFNSTSVLSNLSQWSALSADQQNASKLNFVGGKNLVNYLRGQYGFEDRSANSDKLYRYREATMGDAIESKPVFIGKPTFSYMDSGYDTFKANQAARAKTVFLGTNDGMLHAFDADSGVERWAYVPSIVMPNMWKLADKSYATMHTNFVNGSAVTSDIFDGSSWRSILVGSLHGGGRGFYALDVTDPAAPTFLWEFTNTQVTDHTLKMDDNVGYSFAEPKIGKRPSDGKWVVFLTSGYNNVSPGNGEGWIFELDPVAGTILNKVHTGIGDIFTPSGLAKIEFWADASERDNTAKYIYGGDLLGNLWRVDMSNYSLLNFAVLKDSSGVAQPITTRPEFAIVDDKRVVYVATGKYLEIADLINHQQNTLYAIKDDNAASTFTNPRLGTGADTMVQRTLTNAGANRTVSGTGVSFVLQRGWYVDFPDLGERANVDPQLEFGTLIFPTTVPTSTACAPEGYGWVNYVDYKTGLAASGSAGGYVGLKTNTPPVGINLVMLPDGKVVASVVETGDPTPKPVPGIGFSTNSGGFQGKRVIWREMVP